MLKLDTQLQGVLAIALSHSPVCPCSAPCSCLSFTAEALTALTATSSSQVWPGHDQPGGPAVHQQRHVPAASVGEDALDGGAAARRSSPRTGGSQQKDAVLVLEGPGNSCRVTATLRCRTYDHVQRLPTILKTVSLGVQGAVAVGLHLRIGDSALSNAKKKNNVRYPPEYVLHASFAVGLDWRAGGD